MAVENLSLMSRPLWAVELIVVECTSAFLPRVESSGERSRRSVTSLIRVACTPECQIDLARVMEATRALKTRLSARRWAFQSQIRTCGRSMPR